MPFSRKRPVFTSLSRRKRREKVLALKKLIHKERHIHSEIFYDESDLNFVSGDSDSGRVWSDIYFLGRDPAVLWSAEIVTARVELEDVTGAMAFKEASKLSGEGMEGMAFYQYIQKREKEIIRNSPPSVYCRYQYLPGYTYGLGLRMVVDAVSLNKEIIEAAIVDFLQRGETEWCSPEPVVFRQCD